MSSGKPHVCGVLHDIIRHLALNVQRALQIFSSDQLLPIPTPRRHARQPLLERGIHEDQVVALLLQSHLEQEWYIPHVRNNLRIIGRCIHGRLTTRGDPRMNQAFQPLDLIGMGKNNSGDGRAVDIALAVENRVSPPFPQGLLDGGLLVRFPGVLIGVQNQAAQFAEEAGDRGFAAADSSRQADDGFAREHVFILTREN